MLSPLSALTWVGMLNFLFITINLSATNALEPQATAPQSSSLWAALDNKCQNFEIERINHLYAGMDAMLAKAIISLEKISEPSDDNKVKQCSLLDLLTGPQDINEIVSRLKTNAKKNLNELEQDAFTDGNVHSFLDAVRHLSKKSLLEAQEAKDILLHNSPLKPKDLIRLFQNGIVETKKGDLIKLRTGTSFGDALKLNDDIMNAIRKAQEKSGVSFPDVSLLGLLDGPLRPYVLKAFKDAGLNHNEIISDAHVLQQMRKYFLFLTTTSRINWVKSKPQKSGVSLNPVDASSMPYSSGISAILLSNYYLGDTESSFANALSLNPWGISYSGSYGLTGQQFSWWLTYSDHYIGVGADMTFYLHQASLWSNSNASFLSVGLYGGGWKDNLSAGISLQTLLSSVIGVGVNASVNISRAHDVAFLGQYPLDGPFKNIRGLYKIEINDKKGLGVGAGAAANFSGAGVPLAVAFRANAQYTKKRLYRTHTMLGDAQEMLKEGELPGLLHLAGNHINKTRVPHFDKPELLIDGDELLETKTGKLSGAFIIGLQTLVPLYAARIGADMEITAEFELGLRRLPNDKFEVSIEPRSIHEMSFFASLLDVVGTGQIKSMAIARKQIFKFDFKQSRARRAYFDLINLGILPGREEIEISTDEHGPEYLLAEFRAQNLSMYKSGVQRTYLEKIKINTSKDYVGINSPVVPTILNLINKAHDKVKNSAKRLDLKFEGVDREFMQSYAKCVATNGIISVHRNTVGWEKSKARAHSGRSSQDLFVTHRRLHAVEELPSGLTENKWQFDSLVIHAQLQDTIITGDEENRMVNKLNSLFSTYIGPFEQKNSKAPRLINIERELTRRDLAKLLTSESKERIGIASHMTGIPQITLYSFLNDLKNKHPDQQALMVKRFIQSGHDLSGFAAIHQLLGAEPEDLFVLTESGYSDAINAAQKFIAVFSNPLEVSESPKVDFNTADTRENRKKIQKFYKKARRMLNDIDTQLRLLYDEQYLIDDQSLLITIFGQERVKALIKKGARQDKTALKTGLVSARKTICDLMDLKKQHLTKEDRLIVYHYAKSKHLRFVEQGEQLLNHKALNDGTWTLHSRKSVVREVWDLIGKLNERVEKLKEDQVMIAMDKDYVDNQIRVLSTLTKELLHKVDGELI